MDSLKSQNNRNKRVRCSVCNRNMRSDTLKRHTSTHIDILSMSEDEVRAELKARNAVSLKREEKRQKIEEIAHKEGIPLPKDIIETSFNVDDDINLEGDHKFLHLIFLVNLRIEHSQELQLLNIYFRNCVV